MQTSLLKCCALLLCVCVYHVQPLYVDQEAVNTAIDLVLYFLTHSFPTYLNITDVHKSFLAGNVHLDARQGTFGKVHSLKRVDDVGLSFSDEISNNNDKPTARKMYAYVKMKFNKLHVQYADTVIRFIGCTITGSMNVTLLNNLLEVFLVSSDEEKCLMDIRLVKLHEYGPIDFRIDAAESKVCAAFVSKAVNLFVKYFRDFTKSKLRDLLVDVVTKKLPPKKAVVCLSPTFDVQFGD